MHVIEAQRLFEREGRLWMRNALSPEELARLRTKWSAGARPGARHSNSTPFAQSLRRLDVVSRLQRTWPGMRLVRVVSFEKRPGTNWGVPWHQDRTIAVSQRFETPGFCNWSEKQGQWHCEPPAEILRRMLFVRLHLDENTSANGAMEIAVGSHEAGLVPAAQAETVASQFRHEMTTAAAGDVLVLNMLTLHRSLPSQEQNTRRVIRMDFSADALPTPLDWAG
ncbi:phytanoyl-CoA dioxygenase family protein [Roseovarius sp.]|uniref:phytanoyl-CoA dioxygenase family protein n=1 Tax=Roseovarius sp. TaxID=1486281 RepID=UPI003BA933BE